MLCGVLVGRFTDTRIVRNDLDPQGVYQAVGPSGTAQTRSTADYDCRGEIQLLVNGKRADEDVINFLSPRDLDAIDVQTSRRSTCAKVSLWTKVVSN
jgi:hypothetical protein